MSRRRIVIHALVAGAVGLIALPSKAQPSGRVMRLGLLRPTAPSPGEFMATGIPNALRQLGWVEGQNLRIEPRYADGRMDRMPALARELVAQRCDAIVAVGIGAVRAASDATRTIPIVMFGNFDPLAVGVVASLAAQGNVTGVMIAPEGTLAGKRLELLKEAAPRARRIALLVPDDPNLGLQVRETQQAATALGIDLRLVQVRGTDCTAAFDTLVAERIFKGAQPGELPVEQPTTFQLVINQNTARALNLSLPQTLLLRADLLIE